MYIIMVNIAFRHDFIQNTDGRDQTGLKKAFCLCMFVFIEDIQHMKMTQEGYEDHMRIIFR